MAWLSVASLTIGVVISCFADQIPIPTQHAELIGGLFIVAGLAIVGVGLSPLFR